MLVITVQLILFQGEWIIFSIRLSHVKFGLNKGDECYGTEVSAAREITARRGNTQCGHCKLHILTTARPSSERRQRLPAYSSRTV